MKDIAVEKGLSNIRDYLMNNGYQVSEIDIGQKSDKNLMERFDAVVLSGMDNDFMGIEDTGSEAPVIIASGMKPEDIKARLDTIKM